MASTSESEPPAPTVSLDFPPRTVCLKWSCVASVRFLIHLVNVEQSGLLTGVTSHRTLAQLPVPLVPRLSWAQSKKVAREEMTAYR